MKDQPRPAMVSLTIDGRVCEAPVGDLLIAAAARQGIYIPALCNHPDLPPFCDVLPAHVIHRGISALENQSGASDQRPAVAGCGLCLVEVDGEQQPVRACCTPVSAGLVVRISTPALKSARQANLAKILAYHPHACLTCAQREGCSLENCSSNVPKAERCCVKFHNCEVRKVSEYVGIRPDTPRYRPAGMPVLDDEPLYLRNYELCINCGRCVRACNEVRGVEALGFVFQNGNVVVGSVAPTLLESDCKFCGACVEVCPTGTLLDKERISGDRRRALVPCMGTCPAGVDVPGYIRAVAQGRFAEAAAIVWESLPLPNTLGHICFHQCECECRRAALDEALAICPLKRFALEAGADGVAQHVQEENGGEKQVAIIGGGPAGLAAAYFLRSKGHAVTVFEAGSIVGGQPATSVPDYRLPADVLARDVEVIRGLGVEIRTHARVALDRLAELRSQGFEAVLVAVGLPGAKRIAVDGSQLEGVYWGLEFLTAAKTGRPPTVGREIVVIGGGNVALDVAMTALRLSGGRVRLYCLESRAEMPAHAHEIARAEAEGVDIHPSWGPVAVTGCGERVAGVEFRRCLAVFDAQRRFAPVFDEQQRQVVAADTVILAIGQTGEEATPVERDGVFLAGDVAGGAGFSVVHAVASGRTAAERIDKYLGGDGNVCVRLVERAPPSPWIGRDEGFAPRSRVPVPCEPADERRRDFRPLEHTYTIEQAQSEARRCLQCDLRLMLSSPPLPPEEWQPFDRPHVECVPACEGVFVLTDAERKPVTIKGATDVRLALLEKLASGNASGFFRWEEDRLFTKRESELIQQHVERYGSLPGGGDDELLDLF